MGLMDTKIFFFFLAVMVAITFSFNDFFHNSFANQIFFFLIPILWPGIAHGSLDILTAKRKQIIQNKKDVFFFLLIYLLIPLLFFLLWINSPNLIFFTFLILSIFHFGISDCISSKSKIDKFLEIIIRGMIVICLPIELHFSETLEIFKFLLVDEQFIFLIRNYNQILIYFILIFFLIWLFVNFKKNHFQIMKNRVLIEFLGLFFCFWYFTPLISFFIYFCFLHSVRHLISEKKFLKLSTLELIIKTLPFTFLVILTLISSFFFLTIFQIEFEYLNYLIIGLASLTVSHILLVNFTKN